MSKVAVGKKIPNFKGQATGDVTLSPKDLLGQKYVLYFYPRDNTPGCTQESLDFQALHPKFRRNEIRVIGISRDTLKSHDKFKDKHGFSFELIADPDEEICNLFGVIKDKNMYGKKVRGIERSTFLVDDKGVLRREWRKVKIDGHAEEVLNAAKEI